MLVFTEFLENRVIFREEKNKAIRYKHYSGLSKFVKSKQRNRRKAHTVLLSFEYCNVTDKGKCALVFEKNHTHKKKTPNSPQKLSEPAYSSKA